MSDSQWSLLVGVIIVVVTRAIDVLLPKGYIAKIATKYLVKRPPEKDAAPEEE